MGKRFDLDHGTAACGISKAENALNSDRTLRASEFGGLSSDGKRFDLDHGTEAFVCGISKAENTFKP
jgi:hypothetical protein